MDGRENIIRGEDLSFILHMEQVLTYYYGLLEVVVVGPDVLAGLGTAEKSGVGIITEVVLEAMLDTIENSACETGIVVAETDKRVLLFDMGVADVTLLLDTDVVPALLVPLPSEVEASVAGLELAEVSDMMEEVVEVAPEANELVGLEVRAADTVLVCAGVLAVEVGVVDVLLEALGVVSLEVRAVEVVSELAAALALDVDVIDWFPDFVDPDVEETDLMVGISEVFKTDAELVDLGPAFVFVLVEGDVLVFEVLTTGSLLVGVDIKLSLVLETSDARVVVLSEDFEVLEICDFVLVIAEEVEV